MNYKNPYILREKLGNNALSYEKRENLRGAKPSLTIASLKIGRPDDVQIGEDIVFEEVEDGILKSCKGLKNFIRLTSAVIARSESVSVMNDVAIQAPETQSSGSLRFSGGQEPQNPSITIFDNHNHALYFWCEAIREGIISEGFELIHIDEHSDLWENKNKLDKEKAIGKSKISQKQGVRGSEDFSKEVYGSVNDGEKSDADKEIRSFSEIYAWEYTNLCCNVGNYIRPALDVGIVGNIIRIENNHEVEKYIDYTPKENSVLNLDLDFFAPEMDFIEEEKKIRLIKNLLPKVKCVTIATSPYFIDQGTAIKKLHLIFQQ